MVREENTFCGKRTHPMVQCQAYLHGKRENTFYGKRTHSRPSDSVRMRMRNVGCTFKLTVIVSIALCSGMVGVRRPCVVQWDGIGWWVSGGLLALVAFIEHL